MHMSYLTVLFLVVLILSVVTKRVSGWSCLEGFWVTTLLMELDINFFVLSDWRGVDGCQL